jgi:hypothetical protein
MSTSQNPVMTAIDARIQLRRLQAERLAAVEIGAGVNAAEMASLETAIASSCMAYIGLAVTEIATLRAQLSGAQNGLCVCLSPARPDASDLRLSATSSKQGIRSSASPARTPPPRH